MCGLAFSRSFSDNQQRFAYSFYKPTQSQQIGVYLVGRKTEEATFAHANGRRDDVRWNQKRQDRKRQRKQSGENLSAYVVHGTQRLQLTDLRSLSPSHTHTRTHIFIEGWINATASYLRLKWNFHDFGKHGHWTTGLSLNDCSYLYWTVVKCRQRRGRRIQKKMKKWLYPEVAQAAIHRFVHHISFGRPPLPRCRSTNKFCQSI